MRGSRFSSCLLIVFLLTLSVMVTSTAQEPSGQTLDSLRERLEEARGELSDIQSRASGVKDQVASIDAQTAAVRKGLNAAQALVDRTLGEVGVLRKQIEQKRRVYERVQERAVDIAVSLYKAGPTAELQTVLDSDSLDEMTSTLEYSSVFTEDQISVMVASKRLEIELQADNALLEAKLKDARRERDEQAQFAQHLSELRRAARLKLVDLRKEIWETRREADALADKSAEIAAELGENPASTATLAASASGFAWPFSGSITSGYGPRWGRMHSGIDIDCSTGDPIRASKGGSVVTATYDGSGYGYYVIIDHGGGFATLYAHNVSLAVSAGQSVSQGDVISSCGNTGASTGDHLHFEVRVNGAPQDPLNYLP